jgi:hypothetical protein
MFCLGFEKPSTVPRYRHVRARPDLVKKPNHSIDSRLATKDSQYESSYGTVLSDVNSKSLGRELKPFKRIM